MRIQYAMHSGHGEGKSQDRLLGGGRVLKEGANELLCAKQGMLAVLDGVGGIAGGEVASTFCANELMTADIAQILMDEGSCAVENMEKLLSDIGTVLENCGVMATTCTGILFASETMGLLFHTGNTRVWGLKGNYLRQLTKDQTRVEELVQNGVVVTDEMYKNIGHEIIGCIGGKNRSSMKPPVVEWISLGPYRAFLFTTDGIHEHVEMEELEVMARGEKPVEEAIRIARENGSKDDCSIMLCSFDEEEPEKESIQPSEPETADALDPQETAETLEVQATETLPDAVPAQEQKKKRSLLNELFGKWTE